MRYLSILLVFISLISINANSPMTDKSTVPNLDIDKYLGTWYEIERFDHSFERGLDGVTATYSLKENGKIKVLNQGYKTAKNGRLSKATGKAKIPNPNDPAKLKVAFFLFFYADYFVLELDEDYQWAVVGSTSDNYLWILSRKPYLNDDIHKELLERISARGYDTSKLIKVNHTIDDFVEHE